MCYVIEFIDLFKKKVKITVKKSSHVDVKELNVWMTAQFDYLGVTHTYWGENKPFEIDIPFGSMKVPTITTQEDVQVPFECKKSDSDYVSVQQCWVDTFISKDFSVNTIQRTELTNEFSATNYDKYLTPLPSAVMLRRHVDIIGGGPP